MTDACVNSTEELSADRAEREHVVPLVVDMDGTLVDSDTLFEGLVQLWKKKPQYGAIFPLWLMRGRVGFKKVLADTSPLDAAPLPYNRALIEYLREVKQTRPVVLCTAADHRYANAVAQHLNLFDDVIATEGGINLKSTAKAQELVKRFGKGGFDYAGNDRADVAVFAEARRALVVNPTASLKRKFSDIPNADRFPEAPRKSELAELWRALRPHQWVKNLLVYVPLLAVVSNAHASAFLLATLAFVAFSMIASSVYLLNDLIDLPSDRRHPRKRLRPFAAGTVPIQKGIILIPALLAGGFFTALLVSPLFAGVMLLYALLTLLYSFLFKRIVLLDTLVLAGLYTLRILAGAAAIAVIPSVWLLSFSMFLFLSLALAKRHSELMEMDDSLPGHGIPGREYRSDDLVILISQGTASGYSAVLVLALYVNSDTVRQQYRHPEIIWLICPLVLYWINKLWLNSQRRQIYDEPIVWAIRNRVSRSIAITSVGLLLLARWLP